MWPISDENIEIINVIKIQAEYKTAEKIKF